MQRVLKEKSWLRDSGGVGKISYSISSKFLPLLSVGRKILRKVERQSGGVKWIKRRVEAFLSTNPKQPTGLYPSRLGLYPVLAPRDHNCWVLLIKSPLSHTNAPRSRPWCVALGFFFWCVFAPFSRGGNFGLHSTWSNYSSFYGSEPRESYRIQI